ncbi:hypothetical protein NEILACOT_05685 [Neisseria lactamica ATCC 23970]|uniref:Uncharacterized protein n=1 Tax=Neisseria lactamica ATCC 23970 TaxID=546265 RepID=D0WDP8_NEILA|nr:hypothetical protein NEILACOT_05685 [Neisseria lactamica ATCC 23970]
MGTAWEASGNFNQSKASGSSDSAAIQSGLLQEKAATTSRPTAST